MKSIEIMGLKIKGIESMGFEIKNSIKVVFAVGILSFATGSLAQSQITQPNPSSSDVSGSSYDMSQDRAEERSATTPSTRLPAPTNNISKPTNRLPMALPPQVDPNRNLSLEESQKRASQTLQNLEVCNDDDASCLRRRKEQMRRNSPFQQQVPHGRGEMNTPGDGSNSNIRQ
jgi:hypothetical protein